MDIMKAGARLIVFLLGVLAPSLVLGAPAMVWAEYQKPNINVYLSSDGVRTTAITHNGINVLPNLFRTANSIWVTWVDKSSPAQNRIMYSKLSKNGAVIESGSLKTEYGRVYAPVVAVDSTEQRVWLVWVENNGFMENLYASYRDLGRPGKNEKWRQPLQITPDNGYSNNMPVIDEAAYSYIKLSWLRNSVESFENASADISASEWDQQSSSAADKPQRAKITLTPSGVHYRNLKLSSPGNTQKLMKRLDKARSLDADEQAWKSMVKGRQVLTGAIHSGNGPSKRLATGE